MDSSAISPREPSRASVESESGDERVARASAELGVPVPKRFRLTGVGDDGSQRAHLGGTAQDIRYGVAILARLDGKPVHECLADMDAPPKAGPGPEWAPPADWTDIDAMTAYLAEREQHPEWPQFDNSVADWAVLVSAFLAGGGIRPITEAIVKIHSERARLGFLKYFMAQSAAVHL
jgi:hypothetical protein